MKSLQKLPMAVRLIAAIAAVAVTVALLDAALSIAAPQRDILIARMDHVEKRSSATAVVAMASTGADRLRK